MTVKKTELLTYTFPALRSPFSVLRFPFSVLRFQFSVFRLSNVHSPHHLIS